MSATPTGLTVDAVLRRYSDAEEALAQAAEQLRALSLARDTANAAAASIEHAAEALTALVARVAESTSTTEAAHSTTAAALDTAATFLGSTDLSQVNEHVSRLGQQVDEHGRRVTQIAEEQARVTAGMTSLEAQVSSVVTSLSDLRSDIATMAQRLDRSAQLQEQLAERDETWRRLDGQLTPRLRRKFGLIS